MKNAFSKITLLISLTTVNAVAFADSQSVDVNEKFNNSLNRLKAHVQELRLDKDPAINGPVVEMRNVNFRSAVTATFSETESCEISFDNKIKRSTYSYPINHNYCVSNSRRNSLLKFNDSTGRINFYYLDLLNNFPNEVVDKMIEKRGNYRGFKFIGFYLRISEMSLYKTLAPEFYIDYKFSVGKYPLHCWGMYSLMTGEFKDHGCREYKIVNGQEKYVF